MQALNNQVGKIVLIFIIFHCPLKKRIPHMFYSEPDPIIQPNEFQETCYYCPISRKQNKLAYTIFS